MHKNTARKQLNKTRTTEVGAISEAQKAQNIFVWKKLEIFENFASGKGRTVAKNVKGGPFLIYKHALFQNNKKLKRGSFNLGRFCRLR